jgi:hypothetical protein
MLADKPGAVAIGLLPTEADFVFFGQIAIGVRWQVVHNAIVFFGIHRALPIVGHHGYPYPQEALPMAQRILRAVKQALKRAPGDLGVFPVSQPTGIEARLEALKISIYPQVDIPGPWDIRRNQVGIEFLCLPGQALGYLDIGAQPHSAIWGKSPKHAVPTGKEAIVVSLTVLDAILLKRCVEGVAVYPAWIAEMVPGSAPQAKF